ncbi:PorP/SprF family type IX secretion system membrane protein [Deminuibacter soli]|uniref:Type IX secretion system membrane protein PorP/SprF n=1 Tax=Deminuibacter soli TaxID=2291815 RepID=A0A3E1NE62_9BACT|nr:PorP/SprF family type IX secretion system membrane protein [Deminuibacter soli]RFM26068.1 type IX secretion system membrane protein PorP/SprF [Deminuibacter soli]
MLLIFQRHPGWLCTLLLLLVASAANSQDLHFSQYFNAPLLVNPANTGFEPDADYRLGVNYRNQWASISNNPYKTFSVWGDAQLFNQRFENGWVGIGGALLRDVAGSGNLSSTKAYGSVAYHQMLGLSSLLSMGFSGGLVNKSVDISKLTFDNQWNGKFFDITIPSGEPFAYSSVYYLDLQLGVNYAWFPNENTYLNAGVSVMHLNKPNESFFAQKTALSETNRRMTFFLNGSFKQNDQWILSPNLYYSKMANSEELVLGLLANYNLSGDGNTQLIGGVYVRKGDAAIPMAGYQWNGFKLIVSYDVTTSGLSAYNQSRGAYELSITKTGLISPAARGTKCPVVRF